MSTQHRAAMTRDDERVRVVKAQCCHNNKAGPTLSAYSAHVFVEKHVFLEFCEVTLAIRVFKSRFLFTNVMYLDKGYNFGQKTFCHPGRIQ